MLPIEEIEYIRSIPMVFILGKGRSGTSLLQNLLDTHPQVIGGPESRFVVIFHPLYKHIKKWQETDIIDFVEKLQMDFFFTSFWNLDEGALKQTLLSVKEKADYNLLCKMVYYQMRKDKRNILYISDKNPDYILHIKIIQKIFPEAKFIHIVRDPRDNVYSWMNSFKAKKSLFPAYQWLGYNAIVEKSKKREPEKFHTVLYENLVSNTEVAMKSICGFLHIPFMEEITRNTAPEWLNSHVERKSKDKEQMVHRNLLKPIDTSNVGKWKNKMTPYNQALTEMVTGAFARQMYGYDIDENPHNKTVKISPITLLKGKIIYTMWQEFTRLKVKSFRFNYYYSRIKKKVRGKLAVWEDI